MQVLGCQPCTRISRGLSVQRLIFKHYFQDYGSCITLLTLYNSAWWAAAFLFNAVL